MAPSEGNATRTYECIMTKDAKPDGEADKAWKKILGQLHTLFVEGDSKRFPCKVLGRKELANMHGLMREALANDRMTSTMLRYLPGLRKPMPNAVEVLVADYGAAQWVVLSHEHLAMLSGHFGANGATDQWTAETLLDGCIPHHDRTAIGACWKPSSG